MQPLPPPDLHYRRHHLRGHQAPPHGVVPGHLLHDPGQERRIGDETPSPARHLLQRRMAHAPQAHAGHDGARPRAPPSAGGSNSTMPISGASEAGASAGAGAPGKTPFVAAVETNEQRHPLRMKLTVVEGFRLTEIAAWAQQHLNTGTRVLSDGLACFHGVTEAGCVHEPIVVGSGKAAVERPRVSMGQHDSWQRQECLVWHLPCGPTQVCATLSRGVRVPVQSSLRPARHHPQTRLCGAQDAADAGAAAQVALSLSGNQEGLRLYVRLILLPTLL